MMNNFDENYIIELVKKELSKYLTDQGIDVKKEVCFLGDDNEIKEQLSQKFNFSENAETLIVSQLSLKNLYNISNAIYENEYEEKIIKFVQNIMVAEKLDKILENQTFFDSKSIKDIKEIIENPKQYFKKGHLLEISLNSDLTIHKLNRLRFLARELEIQAIDYFVEDYKVSRKDLLEAFNILSDVIYIIILKVDNGEYR